MAPECDDDVTDLRGNAMAYDALDDGRESAPLVALVGLVCRKFASTAAEHQFTAFCAMPRETMRRITNQGVDGA